MAGRAAQGDTFDSAGDIDAEGGPGDPGTAGEMRHAYASRVQQGTWAPLLEPLAASRASNIADKEMPRPGMGTAFGWIS